jgi:hypothetical protein
MQRNGQAPYGVGYQDLALNANMLYAPAPHFFVGLGPQITLPLSASSAEVTTCKSIGIGGSLILGGWL